MEEAHSDAVTARQIADPGMRVAVIEEDGRLVAFCKLVLDSTLPREFSNPQRPLELKQLYTDPDRVGGGLGRRLMDWAMEVARDRGADEIQLTVYSDNPGRSASTIALALKRLPISNSGWQPLRSGISLLQAVAFVPGGARPWLRV
jgi:GNAT superfamily N-acetyltransferase